MTILDILSCVDNEEALRHVSAPVELVPPGSGVELRNGYPADLDRFIDDMVAAMHDALAVGLSAPQCGRFVRIIAIDPVAAKIMEQPNLVIAEGPQAGETAVVVVNPVIVAKSEGIVRTSREGCLSVPAYEGTVTRCEEVVVEGLDREAKPLRVEAKGVYASVLQHEIDHLDGILFLDRLSSVAGRIAWQRVNQERRRRRLPEARPLAPRGARASGTPSRAP